jgi:hypothetical protein
LRSIYRVRQFFGGLFARVTEADLREADRSLPPKAQRWFRSLPRDLQWHGLQVMRDLKQSGFDRSDMLAAALLHDAGKAVGPSGPIGRAFIVLARKFSPQWFARYQSIDWQSTRGLDRLWAVAWQHPQIAAKRAEECGCDPITIDLIRRHQDRSNVNNDPLLVAFQKVDDRN